jgi:hypothetical protein
MRKVSKEDIIQMNELYQKLGSYAAVARETGFSASTVSKYVDKNYKKVDEAAIIRYQGDLPEFVVEEVSAYKNLGDLCILDDEEEAELQILWGEMQI